MASTKAAPAPAEKFDHVKARFGGKDLVFKIDRRLVDQLEGHGGPALYPMYRAIAAGNFRIADIRTVLKFGLLPKAEVDRRLKRHPMVAALEFDFSMWGRMDKHIVDQVLMSNPPANYAPLALNVIGAALFGVTAEEAIFTDEQADADE